MGRFNFLSINDVYLHTFILLYVYLTTHASSTTSISSNFQYTLLYSQNCFWAKDNLKHFRKKLVFFKTVMFYNKMCLSFHYWPPFNFFLNIQYSVDSISRWNIFVFSITAAMLVKVAIFIFLLNIVTMNSAILWYEISNGLYRIMKK